MAITTFWSGIEPTVASGNPLENVRTPEPGEIIDANYRVERLLGQGGMGMVVLARDLRLDREVAVKLIHPQLLVDPGAGERFLHEARAMARIRHENVAAVYSFGQVDAVPYFVMEYVPGTDLGSVLDSRGEAGLPIDESIRLVRQISRAVEAIHAAGAIHRDLKPSNVLIGSASRVVITDLGLARLMDRPASESERELVAGTPEYLAPELLRAGEPGRASDIYALGVMVYEIFTGHLPFEAERVEHIFRSHMSAEPPVPSSFRSSLPAALDDALLSALEKDPTRRPSSAAAFAREIVAAHEGAAVPASALSILIADDDPETQAYASAVLEEAFPGAQIECVSDGKLALNMLERRQTSLVLLELSTPVLDGYALTSAIRSSPTARSTPIIVMTAVGGGAERRQLAQLGANAFLLKPFDSDELISAARRLLGMPNRGGVDS